MRSDWILAATIHLISSEAMAAQAQSYSHHFGGGASASVHVKSAGGQVRVHASRDDGTTVKGQRTMGDASCTLEAKKGQSGIEVIVADGHGAPCRIDVDIAVAAQADIFIVSEEGNVFVSGMRRKLDLTMTRGNAVVGGNFNTLRAHLVHGSLSAQGVSNEAYITVDEGNAQLWLDPVKEGKTRVALEVGTGNVTLTVPGKDIAIDVGVPKGSIRNALQDNPDAAISVTGQIGSGSLNVRPVAPSKR